MTQYYEGWLYGLDCLPTPDVVLSCIVVAWFLECFSGLIPHVNVCMYIHVHFCKWGIHLCSQITKNMCLLISLPTDRPPPGSAVIVITWDWETYRYNEVHVKEQWCNREHIWAEDLKSQGGRAQDGMYRLHVHVRVNFVYMYMHMYLENPSSPR